MHAYSLYIHAHSLYTKTAAPSSRSIQPCIPSLSCISHHMYMRLMHHWLQTIYKDWEQHVESRQHRQKALAVENNETPEAQEFRKVFGIPCDDFKGMQCLLHGCYSRQHQVILCILMRCRDDILCMCVRVCVDFHANGNIPGAMACIIFMIWTVPEDKFTTVFLFRSEFCWECAPKRIWVSHEQQVWNGSLTYVGADIHRMRSVTETASGMAIAATWIWLQSANDLHSNQRVAW